MKIIISHDVDHLYSSDHFCDLIFPKLWIRSSIELIKGKINFRILSWRLLSIFQKRLNRIPELILYNKENEIPSTFFFGMDNILGLAYKKDAAVPWIRFVMDNGFDVGVHGINFNNKEKIQHEYNEFQKISTLSSFGIRMHYVRFNEQTFNLLSTTGYLFDTTQFNKAKIEIKAPYKIGNMWEFPLYIMDGYILKNGIQKAKEQTLISIEEAKELGMAYFTVLFHDYLFNQNTYPDFKEWYTWLISYLKSNNYQFITYRDAITELENQNHINPVS